jgi:hypothetical protein
MLTIQLTARAAPATAPKKSSAGLRIIPDRRGAPRDEGVRESSNAGASTAETVFRSKAG